MVWVGALEMQVLRTFGRFDVYTCLEPIVLYPDVHIEESYVFPREGLSKLDGKGGPEILQECFLRLVRESRKRKYRRYSQARRRI